VTRIIDNFYFCANCSAALTVTYVDRRTGYVQVDSGLCVDLSGGYAEFCDYAPEQNRVLLCHDCSLIIARALPGVFRPGSGMHPHVENGLESCCEFGWSIDGSGCTVVGDGNGGWVQKYDPDGRLIE